MTDYDTLKVRLGRKAVTVIELDLDFCGNTYGSAPCTASLGVTGTAKCYNTFKSCQDAGNFNKQVKTYRLCKETSYLPIGENILPCITDFSIAPTKIEATGISLRASISITCKDFPHHDRGIDPYYADRATPVVGTFFGRLKARNPYVVNRPLRVRTGYIDNDRVIYDEVHHYLIDSIDGPDANGRVTIKAKDVLKLADDDTAQCPVPTRSKLPADMTADQTTLAITPDSEISNFPSSGILRIGDEILSYASKTVNGFTGVVRGLYGSTADTHATGDKVQLCAVYENQTIPYILNDLLANYASIPSSYIPLTDWNEEFDRWLGLFKYGALISEPTGVSKLIGELLDSSYTMLWWDEVDAEIKFKVRQVPMPDGIPPNLTDADNLLGGTMQVKTSEKDRVTRVDLYYGIQRIWDTLDKSNMRSLFVQVDSDAESVNAHGEPKDKEVVSRWISSDPIAKDLAFHTLARYRDAPTKLTFRLDAKDTALRTGSLGDVYTRLYQEFDGSDAGVRLRITERHEAEEGAHWEYLGEQDGRPGEVACLYAGDDVADFDSASETEKATYGYLADDDGMLGGAPSDRLMF